MSSMKTKPSLGLTFVNKPEQLPAIKLSNPFYVNEKDERLFLDYESQSKMPIEAKHSLTMQNKPDRKGVLRMIKGIPKEEEKVVENIYSSTGEQLALPSKPEIMYMKAVEDGTWPEGMQLMKNEEKSEVSSQEPQEDIQKKLLYLNQGKRESFREYVQNINKVFLAKKSILDKREEIKRMTEFINDKDCVLKDSEKCFKRTKENFNKFLEEIQNAAKNAKEQLENKTIEKNKMQAEIDILKHEEFSLEKEIEKSIEKLKELISHKSFLDEFNREHSETQRKLRAKRIEDRRKAPPVQGGMFITQGGGKDLVELSAQNKKKLEEVNITEYDSEDEFNIGFSNPNELIEKIHTLEKENIEAIEYAQNIENEHENEAKNFKITQDNNQKELKIHEATQQELNTVLANKTVISDILEKKSILPIDEQIKKEEIDVDKAVIVTKDNKARIYEMILEICKKRGININQNESLLVMLKMLEGLVKDSVNNYKECLASNKNPYIEIERKKINEDRKIEKINSKKIEDEKRNNEKKNKQLLKSLQTRKVYNHKDLMKKMKPTLKVVNNNGGNTKKNAEDEENKYLVD